jgi:Domain of unknown function (DUF5606)
MEYSKIIAVTGLPGLYELVSSKNDGAIVRSLDDKSTRFVASRVHNFSHLESIEIYTIRDNVNLVEVLTAMDKNGDSLPDLKDNDAVKKYFQSAYPDMDFERVYASDMKKMIKWYEVLKKNNIEIKLTQPEEIEEEAAPAPEPVKESKKPKTAAKAEEKEEKTVAPKKAATSKAKAADKEEKATPPRKVAASKAKKEEKEEKAAPKKAAPKKKK